MIAVPSAASAGDVVAKDGQLAVRHAGDKDMILEIKSSGRTEMLRNIKYRDLNSKQKNIYNRLLKAYRSTNKTRLTLRFYNSSYSQNDFLRAKWAFNNQLMRYTLGIAVYQNSPDYWYYTNTGRFAYWEWTVNTAKTRTRMKQNTANIKKLKKIARNVTRGKYSTRAQVIAINNYVCSKLTYSLNLGSLHSALNGRYTKCTGYACLFKAICEVSGIDCWMVFGYAGGGHAWNQVRINGKWYYVDPTWNDSNPRNRYLLKSGLWSDHSDVYVKLDVTNFHQYGRFH